MDVSTSHSLDGTPHASRNARPTDSDPGDDLTIYLGRFALDADVRRTGQGRTLLGGSPFRLMRFSGVGSELIDALVAGDLIPATAANQKLVSQLVEGGLVHPIIAPRYPKRGEVTIVIPVFGDVDGLHEALAAITDTYPEMPVIVVDDGSSAHDAVRIAEVAAAHPGVELQRLQSNQGPAAARNVGWRTAETPLVAFLDADVLARDWLSPILGHFDERSVAAVAPRVSAPNPQRTRVAGSTKPASALNRYERVRSSLDMGHRSGRVAPRTRVSYAPAAALLVRRDALEALQGFDETLRFGEDVDFLWRLDEAGHQVRYDPASRVEHRNRLTWPALARQRMSYGSSAADLDQRHTGLVAPVEATAPVLGSWVLFAFGGKPGALVAAGLGVRGAGVLRETLRNHVDDPTGDAVDLTVESHRNAGGWLAAALTRTWLPFAVVGSIFSRRVRRATVAAMVIPASAEWYTESPDLDLPRWIAARVADDASYCLGVWKGAAQAKSANVLLPKINRKK